jgi:SAM-dependent methyltransferase
MNQYQTLRMNQNLADFQALVQEGLSHPFFGWDFSFLGDRWKTSQPSWDYPSLARKHMRGIQAMLDQDTGGGELFSSLAPFPLQTWATESYPPNIPIAKKRLEPLGIEVISEYRDSAIPLPDASLDLVLNRHGSYCEAELMRLLKPGGIFLTEQVGGQNCIRLNELLQDNVEFQYSYWTKELITKQLITAGFELLHVQEEFPPAEFADIGAVVFYLRIISWQVADFSVEKYLDKLYAIHTDILAHGPLPVNDHRILVEACKPMGHSGEM